MLRRYRNGLMEITKGLRTIGAQRARIVVYLVFVLLLSADCSNRATGTQADSDGAKKSIPIKISKVELRKIRRNVESVGTLFPYEEVTVSSEVEGKVEEVLVDVGDRVAARQPLVRVSPVELRLEVEQKKATLQQARARLGLTSRGEDLRDVNDAAEVKKAAADLNDAEKKHLRAKSLLDQGLLPRESYDEAEAKYKSARAAHDLAVQMVNNLRAQIAQHEASLALAEKKLNDSTIQAPFAGQIKERSVTLGQYLRVQTPVMVIVDSDPLRVRLKVPEKMAGWIRTGQPATIAVEAYPDDRFSGKVSRINPTVDAQTRTFEVEALIANTSGLLKPGFFVRANIPSDRIEEALFIPHKALYYVYGAYKTFVVQNNTLSEREVRIGERAGEDVEIVEGLVPGEPVSMSTQGSELRDRAPVTVVE